MRMLMALLLAALPVTMPEEWGRLVVVESFQTPASSTIVIEYTNDTGRELHRVRLECVLLDHRGAVVEIGAVVIPSAASGAKSSERIRIIDSSQRASRAECRIAGAR